MQGSRFDFFIVVAPGLVDLAEAELNDKWPGLISLMQRLWRSDLAVDLEVKKEQGGLLLVGLPLRFGVLLNIYLKIPTRILLRLASFRCRDFPKLYNKCKKINWQHWFDDGPWLVKASAHKSRLMLHTRLEETASDAIGAYKKEGEHKWFARVDENEPDNLVLLRLDEDVCTISIDTSGLPLYKRNEGKEVGVAPLRETLAAALFYQTSLCLDGGEDWQWVDPMLGSGTSVLEAASFWQTHRRTAYNFLRFRGIAKQVRSETFAGLEVGKNPFGIFIGFDKSQAAIARAAKNLQSLPVELTHADAVAGEVKITKLKKGVVFINPPYGKRLKLAFGLTPAKYFKQISSRLCEGFAPEWFGLIVPRENASALPAPLSYRLHQRLDFLNGGLKVCYLLYQRQKR